MTRNEPTTIMAGIDDWIPPAARVSATVHPFGQDLLWDRLRCRTQLLTGVTVDDPRQAFSVTAQ